MASAAELAILLRTQGADQVSGAIGGIGEKLGGLGKIAAIGMAAVGGAAIAAGAALLKVGTDFDEAFDTIRMGTGATGEALEGLKVDMKAAFADVPADMKDVGQAIADLNTRLGLTGEPLQTMAKQMLELSRLTKTEVSANIRETTRVFGDWGVSVDKQAETLDMMFRATQVTGIGLSNLMGKVVQFGAPLRAMGFGLGESVAMLGKWEKEGVNTELVLGSLRIAMGEFARQNIPMRQGLDETVKKIQALGPSAGATALAMEVFGARAGPDMAAAILEGRFAFADLMKAIEGGKDTIMGVGKETMDAGEKFTILKNRAMVLIEPLASGLFGALTSVADGALKLADNLGSTLGVLGKFKDALANIISGKADWGAFTYELQQAFGPDAQAAGEKIIGTFQTIGQTLGDAFGPPLLELFGNMQAFWSDVQVLVGPALENIKALIGTFLSTVKEWWDRHGRDIMAIVQGLFTILQGVFQVAFSIIGGIVKVFLALLGGDFEGAGKALEEMWKGVWKGVQKIFSGAFTVITGLLWTWVTTMGEIGASIGQALWDALVEKIREIRIDIGPFHLSAEGFTVDMPSFPWAGGGAAAAVGAMAGESPMTRGVQALGGGGGMGIAPPSLGRAGSPVTVQNVFGDVHLRDRGEIDYFAAQVGAKQGAAVNRALRLAPVGG